MGGRAASLLRHELTPAMGCAGLASVGYSLPPPVREPLQLRTETPEAPCRTSTLILQGNGTRFGRREEVETLRALAAGAAALDPQR